MYKTHVFHFMHLFYIQTGSVWRGCLTGYVFKNTTVSLKLSSQVFLLLRKCLTNFHVSWNIAKGSHMNGMKIQVSLVPMEWWATLSQERISIRDISHLVQIFTSTSPNKSTFSLINSPWSDQKSTLKQETVRALTITNTHFSRLSCVQFYTSTQKFVPQNTSFVHKVLRPI
jgi:hypothetical protein